MGWDKTKDVISNDYEMIQEGLTTASMRLSMRQPASELAVHCGREVISAVVNCVTIHTLTRELNTRVAYGTGLAIGRVQASWARDTSLFKWLHRHSYRCHRASTKLSTFLQQCELPHSLSFESTRRHSCLGCDLSPPHESAVEM